MFNFSKNNKEIIILTASIKYGKYCVAGIEKSTGKWIRLVSDDAESHGALSKDDIMYRNNEICKPLDIVNVKIIRDEPLEFQPENVLINTKKFFKKLAECTLDELFAIHSPEQYDFLFGNLSHYVPEAKISALAHSLLMVRVKNLNIQQKNINSTKASFTYNSEYYSNIAVTDPKYFGREPHFKEAIIVMSLPAVPYTDGNYYKFIAKIFPLDSDY